MDEHDGETTDKSRYDFQNRAVRCRKSKMRAAHPPCLSLITVWRQRNKQKTGKEVVRPTAGGIPGKLS